ncbi:uncharacterized protein CDV56_105641 [Aspergillus thermomutatus]|uniref:Zn(2)-C6 fungal-type domain-containing protein n=1 Tax=Aspergillus thermomutatus TaxID=41047 RepID=A0A397H6Y6_ASPTH|nr:uncharacterized protein CDV56_105641 [Aspergillus thermomutatus]RHZ57678.1 hypothetical protein CDV56_105641 [Aspergillus thermomutatus]
MEDIRRSRAQRSREQSGPPVIKLRSSCDYCTDSKVRCDKQHPSCGRCTKLGHRCQYSVSLRTARLATLLTAGENHGTNHGDESNEDARNKRKRTPPAAMSGAGGSIPPSLSPSRPSSRTSASSTDRRNHGMSDPPAASELSTSSGTKSMPAPTLTDGPGYITPFSFESGFADPKSAYVTENGQELEDDFLLNHLPGASSHLLPLDPSAGLQRPCPDVATTAHEFGPLWAWPDFVDQPMLLSGTLSSHNNAPFNLNTSGEWDENGATAMSTLKPKPIDMHSPGLGKSMTMTSESNESNTGLATPLGHDCTRVGKRLLASVNRLSMRDEDSPSGLTTGQALLVCSGITKRLQQLLECSCKEDPHLPFLIAVIISNVLIIYSSIAQISIPPFCRGRSVAFRPAPLTVGVYEMDDEAGRLLNAQLVVHELRKIRQLEARFSEKYCRTFEAETGERDIYSALGNFVGQRLNQTIEACSGQGLNCD